MIVAQVFLEAMEGCNLFLSPFFVIQPGFSGSAHPRLCKYSFRRAAKMASRWFRRRVSEALRDWACRLVSTPSGGLSVRRFNAARSRRALNRGPIPGWFSEIVWQLPVLARFSSTLLCPWNFRWTLWKLPACGQLRGALPAAHCSPRAHRSAPVPPRPACSRWRRGDARDKQTEKLRESSPLLATCGERTRRSRRCGPSSSRRPVFRIFPL